MNHVDWTPVILAGINVLQVVLIAVLNRRTAQTAKLVNGHLQRHVDDAFAAGERAALDGDPIHVDRPERPA